MKAYMPAIIPVTLVILGIAISFAITPALESPEFRFNHQIAEHIEKAQRLLAGYDPAATRLAMSLGPEAALPTDIQHNETALEQALAEVRKAISMREQAGDEMLTGDTHPTATRLEAILIYYQADLLCRQAAVHRTKADRERNKFAAFAGPWREVDTIIQSTQRSIAEAKTSTQPADSPPNKLPTLAERIAERQDRHKQIVTQINEVQAEADRLRKRVNELEKQIAAVRTQAIEAEKRMFALEEADYDPTDPEALQRFITAYNQATQAHRKAAYELSILENGSIRNARPDTDDEEAMLKADLVPIDQAKEMKPERGLIALQSDLRAADGLVETNKALLAEIDKQITELTERQVEVTEQLAQLWDSRAGLSRQATQAMQSAVAAMIEADKLEAQALDMVENAGRQAAARAKRAADKRISDARAQSAEHPGAPNPRLSLILKNRFSSGHARTLAGDLEYLIAKIQAQRATDLDCHLQMLRETERMKIDGAKLLPEGLTTTTAPESVFQSQAAEEAADETRGAAVSAASAALEIYQEADADLARLWLLHTNIAATHYLLANLTSGAEAEEHRRQARLEYESSIHDRRDHPEAKRYERIIEGLTQAAQ